MLVKGAPDLFLHTHAHTFIEKDNWAIGLISTKSVYLQKSTSRTEKT